MTEMDDAFQYTGPPNSPYKYKDLTRRVVGALRDGPKTRGDLVTLLGVPRTSIYDRLVELIKRGLVKKYPRGTGERKRGRPKVYFELTTKED